MNDQHFKILPSFLDTIHDADADIYLTWGGRDRGASHYTAQRAIVDCLTEPYYRAVLIRKTYESIRDSQYQTIKDIVEANNLSEYFTFLRSPLEIRCFNGNKFISRGCDDPVKMKSLKDPNVAIIEEADQLTEDDYIIIHTTLRHESAKIRQWLAFNSDLPGDYKEHWLWRYYLSRIPNTYESGLYKTEVEVSVGEETITQEMKFYSMHSTYLENPYCPPTRRAVYEGLKEKNPYYYQVYAKGILGERENDNPWLWAYDNDRHFMQTPYEINKNYPLVLSFDFNHDPCALVVGQLEQHRPRYNVFAYYQASSKDQSALKQLCDIARREYPYHINTRRVIVTGDASGKQRDASRPSNMNRYTDICRHLALNEHSTVKIELANTPHKASRDLCNDILHDIPQGGYLFYGGKGIENLLVELRTAYPDDKESLNKAKKEHGLHGLDAWRYLNQYWFAQGLKGARFREYKRKLTAIKSRLKAK